MPPPTTVYLSSDMIPKGQTGIVADSPAHAADILKGETPAPAPVQSTVGKAPPPPAPGAPPPPPPPLPKSYPAPPGITPATAQEINLPPGSHLTPSGTIWLHGVGDTGITRTGEVKSVGTASKKGTLEALGKIGVTVSNEAQARIKAERTAKARTVAVGGSVAFVDPSGFGGMGEKAVEAAQQVWQEVKSGAEKTYDDAVKNLGPGQKLALSRADFMAGVKKDFMKAGDVAKFKPDVRTLTAQMMLQPHMTDGQLDPVAAVQQYGPDRASKYLKDAGYENPGKMVSSAQTTIKAEAVLKRYTQGDAIDIKAAVQALGWKATRDNLRDLGWKATDAYKLVKQAEDQLFTEKRLRDQGFMDDKGNIDTVGMVHKKGAKYTHDMLQTLGVSDLGRVINDAKSFVSQNVALGDGSFISRSDYHDLTRQEQRLVMTGQGLDALSLEGLKPQEQFAKLQERGRVEDDKVFVRVDNQGNFVYRDRTALDNEAEVIRRTVAETGKPPKGYSTNVGGRLADKLTHFRVVHVDGQVYYTGKDYPKTTAKDLGLFMGDLIIPGFWARNWSKMGNAERGINIAIDLAFVGCFTARPAIKGSTQVYRSARNQLARQFGEHGARVIGKEIANLNKAIKTGNPTMVDAAGRRLEALGASMETRGLEGGTYLRWQGQVIRVEAPHIVAGKLPIDVNLSKTRVKLVRAMPERAGGVVFEGLEIGDDLVDYALKAGLSEEDIIRIVRKSGDDPSMFKAEVDLLKGKRSGLWKKLEKEDMPEKLKEIDQAAEVGTKRAEKVAVKPKQKVQVAVKERPVIKEFPLKPVKERPYIDPRILKAWEAQKRALQEVVRRAAAKAALKAKVRATARTALRQRIEATLQRKLAAATARLRAKATRLTTVAIAAIAQKAYRVAYAEALAEGKTAQRAHTIAVAAALQAVKTAVRNKTQVQAKVEAQVKTDVARAVKTATAVLTDTEVKTETAVAFKAELARAVETAVKAELQPMTKPQLEAALKLKPRAKSQLKTPPFKALPTPTKTMPATTAKVTSRIPAPTSKRKRRRLPRLSETKTKEREPTITKGIMSWNQGAFAVTVRPVSSGDQPRVVVSYERIPIGSKVSRIPKQTLSTKGGKVPSEVRLGMGVVRASVKGGRRISFKARKGRRRA